MGNFLLKHVRGEDIVCRYGGDEFIIVLPDVTQAVACKRAELICKYARQFHLQFEGQALEAITLSYGVAVFPKDGSISMAILKAADDALYSAKRERGPR
jgi:diguanylate cyclase (GGDEF)-like protein